MSKDTAGNADTQKYYTLDEYNTVTVEGCPYCGETHVFSIEPQWVTIQKARTSEPVLPQGVKKFIVKCPKEHSLFEIYVDVGKQDR